MAEIKAEGRHFVFETDVFRLIWLAVIGVVTTVVSSYYYLYMIVQMYMREAKDEFADVAVPGSLKLALAVAAAGTLYLGVLPARVLDWAAAATLAALR